MNCGNRAFATKTIDLVKVYVTKSNLKKICCCLFIILIYYHYDYDCFFSYFFCFSCLLETNFYNQLVIHYRQNQYIAQFKCFIFHKNDATYLHISIRLPGGADHEKYFNSIHKRMKKAINKKTSSFSDNENQCSNSKTL